MTRGFAAAFVALVALASLQVTTASADPPCPNQALRTGRSAILPDCRAWELVSPPEKGGGSVKVPGQTFGGGVLQAAADGDATTFSSTASFGAEARGAPGASQYISRRTAAGWTTEDITLPTASGAYGDRPDGVPYQLFSPDLTVSLLLDGARCSEGEACPRSYSLRETTDGALAGSPAKPDLRFAGASPDLRHLVLSTCAALTPAATEVPGAEGCDPTKPNLYQWSGGALALINIAPGGELAAQDGAVSANGSRVYFTEAGGLWLREGAAAPRQLAAGGEFQTASADGAFAFFTKAGHLYRYDAAGEQTTDLTPGGQVSGVLGASQSGAAVYYQDAAALQLWHAGATTEVSPGAATAPSDYPPATATARISADGTHLAFLSKASLTGYDNTDQTTAEPDDEVYLYEAPTGSGGGRTLTCVSCNPTGARPLGPSTIPGAIANGAGPDATDSYKPRALSTDGLRVFFDSGDTLLTLDFNTRQDVYEWEAQGEGTCRQPAGCLGLISAGLGGEDSQFIDASADGSDAIFLTVDSLLPADPGSFDLYDAREAGGFLEPPVSVACQADACQPLLPEPEDPTPATLLTGPGNPPLHFPKTHHRRHHHRHRGSR
jgi:hypothetical protein